MEKRNCQNCKKDFTIETEDFSYYEKIKVPVPPLQKQEALIHLFRNMREQKKILDRKSEITQNIINATFKSLVTA